MISLLIILLIILVIGSCTGPMRGGWMLHLQCSYPTGILEPTERLEQPGFEVGETPTVITITYKQIYANGSTLEEAVVTFLGEALSRYEALRKRSGLTPL